MAASCRFAFAVHVLAVLAYKHKGGACSDALAGSVNTNPVVVRRLLSRLRKAGLIKTQRGACGGAALCGPSETITLDAVYRAVESGSSLASRRKKPDRRCPVGAGIEPVLDEIFASAQAAIESTLARWTLRDVLEAITAATPRRKIRRARSHKAA